MKKVIFVFIMILVSSPCLATRGYVGNNPVSEIMYAESSAYCGPSNGACLVLWFEGGALGCSPASQYISFDLNEVEYKAVEAMAYISITAKKKFRTYATIEYCGDSQQLNPNGATLYDVAH